MPHPVDFGARGILLALSWPLHHRDVCRAPRRAALVSWNLRGGRLPSCSRAIKREPTFAKLPDLLTKPAR